MNRPFEQILNECIHQLEVGGTSIPAILARYPEYAEALRPHLQLWDSLSNVGRDDAGQSGYARGLQQLTGAVSAAQQSQGGNVMTELSRTGAFALKMTGAVAIVAALTLGIAYFSGNMSVGFGGDEAQADHTNACLDNVLGNLADPPDGHFTFEDLLAFKDAFQEQNTDPRYDTDGDGDVDIDDVMSYIQDLKTCFSESAPPAPPGG
jgi:hypothetical protein